VSTHHCCIVIFVTFYSTSTTVIILQINCECYFAHFIIIWILFITQFSSRRAPNSKKSL